MGSGLGAVARRALFRAPARLARNHRAVDAAGLARVEQSIRANFHTGWRSEERYSQAAYAADLAAHLRGRLEADRGRVVPWLDAARPLRGQRLLEIGCGTGSSTVALAEQGAAVTAIDIDEGALAVARDRCAVYGVQAELRALGAEAIGSAFAPGGFDAVVFYACLEHLTLDERLASLQQAWAILRPRGLLVVVETPNRLWYFDHHTSHLPFFQWLPDELAFRCARFSPRENFRELYGEPTPEAMTEFLRRGRGVSFHELEVAIGPARTLDVVSSLSTYEGLRHALLKTPLDRRYKALLRRTAPGLHEGFFDDTLYLVIRKA